MTTLENTHRFKSGSVGRRLRGRIVDVTGALLTKAQLDSLSTLTMVARLHSSPSSDAILLTHYTVDGTETIAGVTTTWNIEADVASLDEGFWLVEVHVDDGSGLIQPPDSKVGELIEVFSNSGNPS